MKKAFGRGAAVICALFMASCGYIAPIIGSGRVVTNSYGFTDFTAIEASSAMDVNVTVGSDYSVSVSCDDNIMPHMTVKVVNGALHLGDLDIWQVWPTKMTATVTMPAFNAALISGKSSLTVTNFSSTNFSADVSGASTLRIGDSNVSGFSAVVSGNSTLDIGTLACDSMNIDVSGASTVTVSSDSVSGSALVADVSGESHAFLYKLPFRAAKLLVSGASGVEVTASDSVSGEASGASSVRYQGTAVSSVLCSGASSCIHN